MKTDNPILENIWLADDDIDDFEIFEDALKQILPNASLTIASNGEELIKMLTDASKIPDILFLDINMPCKDGLDCLVEIRSKLRFSKLPVVIFTSSQQPKHINASYSYGANLYFTKPSSFDELIAGLGNLFAMNWNDPCTITSSHFINNKFVPYGTNKTSEY
jgi:CheY-like chemotaxis protein